MLRAVLLEIELGLDPDVLGSGYDHGGFAVQADFVGGFEGFGYFDLGQKRILVLPGGGSFFALED